MTRWRIILASALPLLLAQGPVMPPDSQIPLMRPNATTSSQSDIYFWLMVIVAFAVAVGLTGYFIYRRIKKANETESASLDAAFSLSEMRRLYEAGEISHEEYVIIRTKLLGPAKAAMLGPDKPAADAEPSATPDTMATSTPPPPTSQHQEPDASPKPSDPLFEWDKTKDAPPRKNE